MTLKYERVAWGFFRTMAEDYGRGTKDGWWPTRRLGPDFDHHLKGLAWEDGRLFERETKAAAAKDGRVRWHGHPVRIRITAEVQ